MKTMEVVNLVADTRSAHMFKLRKDCVKVKGSDYEYDVKPLFTGNKRGWVILDIYTVSAIMAVYNALTPENQAKINLLSIPKVANFALSKCKAA